MKIELHNDDVVHLEANMSLTEDKTSKVGELAQSLKDRVNNPSLNHWFDNGVECECLRASEGGGWQTGKIRIRFEFIPDVPDEPAPEVSDAVRSPNF